MGEGPPGRSRLACRPVRISAKADYALRAAAELATEVDALVTVAFLAALLAGLIAYEALRFAEARDRVRHQTAHEAGPPE